ncbi:arginine kinase, partial [Trypanosoma theileri]
MGSAVSRKKVKTTDAAANDKNNQVKAAAADVKRNGKEEKHQVEEKKKHEESQANDGKDNEALLKELEEAFQKLHQADECHSLLKKYLTKEVFDELKDKKTSMGATLMDVIQSGVANLDSGIGLYAPDAESYKVFAALFDPVIEEYHQGFKPSDKQPPKDFGDLSTLVDVDPENKYVISTRVRCARNLDGYPFNPLLKKEQYEEIESRVKAQ